MLANASVQGPALLLAWVGGGDLGPAFAGATTRSRNGAQFPVETLGALMRGPPRFASLAR